MRVVSNTSPFSSIAKTFSGKSAAATAGDAKPLVFLAERRLVAGMKPHPVLAALTGLFVLCVLPGMTLAEKPFFQADDVVALIGGEDMVAMRDEPSLELAVLAQPGLGGVRFRNLAFEGDTVFEQPRDLNFPSWEKQLSQVGATVVIAQFGKMESFAGPDGLPAFVEAYGKLLDHLGAGHRRLALLSPGVLAAPADPARQGQLRAYVAAIKGLAEKKGARFVDWAEVAVLANPADQTGVSPIPALGLAPAPLSREASARLLARVREKNMLWFHYWRPQNWAFLHGDRTEQPSSRDHLDPSKRWFPAEMEQWLPLIAEKEHAISAALSPSPAP